MGDCRGCRRCRWAPGVVVATCGGPFRTCRQCSLTIGGWRPLPAPPAGLIVRCAVSSNPRRRSGGEGEKRPARHDLDVSGAPVRVLRAACRACRAPVRPGSTRSRAGTEAAAAASHDGDHRGGGCRGLLGRRWTAIGRWWAALSPMVWLLLVSPRCGGVRLQRRLGRVQRPELQSDVRLRAQRGCASSRAALGPRATGRPTPAPGSAAPASARRLTTPID